MLPLPKENEDPFAPKNADSDDVDDDDDGDGGAVEGIATRPAPSGTNWITGGAGIMSRWLLNSASGTGTTEAASAEGDKSTSSTELGKATTRAVREETTDGESLVSNLGRKAVFPRRTNSYSTSSAGPKDASIPSKARE